MVSKYPLSEDNLGDSKLHGIKKIVINIKEKTTVRPLYL